MIPDASGLQQLIEKWRKAAVPDGQHYNFASTSIYDTCADDLESFLGGSAASPEVRFAGHPLHDPNASAETLLRGEWWMNHGTNCRQYGDDGEMQCCGLDFRRMPLNALRERVKLLRIQRLREVSGEAVTAPSVAGEP